MINNPLHELREILRLELENQRLLRELLELILNRTQRFVISLEINMAIGQLSSPGTASISLALLDNGAPYTPPAGSTYVFTSTLSASDSAVTIAADPSVPNQFDVTIPGGDPSTSVTFTASATAPDGTAASGTLTVPMTLGAQQFSISVTQSA